MKLFFPLEVFYPSQAGGPANSVYWLTKNLRKAGFEPVIVASDKGLADDFPRDRWREDEAGRVIYVRTRFLHVPVRQTLLALRNFASADVVHVSSVFYPTAFILAVAAKLFKKKMIWSARGELSSFSLNYSKLRKAIVLKALVTLVGKYPLFHSTCDEETETLRAIFGADARIVQIPNFVEIAPLVERTPGRYFLYIGRLHKKKGIDLLMQALATNEAFLDSDYKLKVAGRGRPSYEKELREIAAELDLQDRVQFVGQVEGEQKNKLFADADWTFMPSHNENFGIVVLESLAQNTPVVATEHSPWESLESEGLGIWTGNSPEVLSKVVTRILEMGPEEYAAYRHGGREFVMRNFDMEQNIDRWVETYNSLS